MLYIWLRALDRPVFTVTTVFGRCLGLGACRLHHSFPGTIVSASALGKAMFVFLTLFCLLQIGSDVYWLSYPVNAVAHRPLTIQLYRSLFMSIAVGLIVYVYYRISQQQQKV